MPNTTRYLPRRSRRLRAASSRSAGRSDGHPLRTRHSVSQCAVMTGPDPSVGEPAPIRYIETQAAFDILMQEFADASPVAVDTEAASFHRYLDRIYLIQLS